MKKAIFRSIVVLAAVLSGAVYAADLSQADAKALLQKVDETTSFYGTDFAANYSLVQEKPGQGKSTTTVVMYRRDDADAYTILITGPEKDRGKGYVQFDNNIWFYDPSDRQFVFTSAKDNVGGTNATPADFTPQHYSKLYKIDKAEKVKLGKLDCAQLTLTATSKNVNYPTIKLWVTEEDGLIRMKEDYSLSGQLLRTTAIPSYQKFKDHSVPSKMVVVDNLRGKKINGKMQYE
ncbi:MAG: outer membrane lipoprotein-sorting protein, partial [Treponema sp.]|nr:outer membrane lipoprotein-sorting protein [Treponema sp.]